MAGREVRTDQYLDIDRDIKTGEYSSIYVFHGVEAYLLDLYRVKLKNAVVQPDFSEFNYHRLDEESFSTEVFADVLQAFPMMGDHVLIELVGIDPFKLSERGRDDMTELLSDIPDTSIVLFTFQNTIWKMDGRKKKLASAMKKAAIVEFCEQTPKTLIRWTKRELKAAGKHAGEEDIAYLIERVGADMSRLRSEIDKLCSYCDEDYITREDIDSVTIPTLEASVFQITDRLSAGDVYGAVEILHTLLAQDEDPIAINAVIGRRYRQMLAAKVLMEQRKSEADLARICRMQQYPAKLVFQYAGHFSLQKLSYAVRVSAEADYACKSSAQDNSAVLEDMLLKIGMYS